MDGNFDVVAAISALVGAAAGAISSSYRSGKAWQRVEDKISLQAVQMSHFDEKLTLICDELARRITNVENRVQYDGYYVNPRIRRDGDTGS